MNPCTSHRVSLVPSPWRIIPLIACFLAFVWSTPAVQAADETARDEWMKGFEKLEEARQAEDAGRRELAASLYASALEIFTDVSSRHPAWNPALLRYRIRFCRDKIADLRKSIEIGGSALSKNELLEERDDLRRKIEALQSSLRSKTREHELTAQAMERARREAARNAAAREQTDSLLEERRELVKRLADAERQLAGLRAELADLKSDDRERRRAAMLADRLQLVESEKAREAEELDKNRRTLAEAERRLTTLGEERERLRTENAQAKEALARHEKNLHSQKEAIAAVTRQLGEEKQKQAVAGQQKLAAERRAENALRRTSELQERLADMERQVKQVEKAKTDAESKIAGVPGQLEALTDMIQAKDRELADVREALRVAVADADAKEQQAARIRALADNQSADLRRLQSQLETLEEGRINSTALVRELETKLEHASRGRSGMQDSVDRYREQLAQLERDQEMATRQAESRLNLLRRQEQEIRSLGRRIDELVALNETLQTTPAPVKIPAPAPEFEELQKRLRNALTENEYQRQLTEEARRDLQREKLRATALESDLNAATKGEADAQVKLRNELAEVRATLALETRRAREMETKRLPRQAVPPVVETTDSELAVALLHKGVEAEKGGNLEAAIWNYRKLLENQPSHLVALRRLGSLALETGNDGEAIGYLGKAFYADPDHLETLQQLGFALVRQDNPELALSMLARAAALNQDNPQIHNQLGVACSTLGWKDAAEVQFRRALKLAPKDPESAFNLAVLLASSDDQRLDEAKQWYKIARDEGAEADPALDNFFGYQNP